MAGRFVRSSKYRHVFGRSTRKEQCYDNIRISRNAWDTNLVKSNPTYLSVNWEASGGGAFAVIPLEEKGRLPEHIPLFRGHTSVVLDTDWSPFDDSLIASGSDDGKVFIWRVPEGFTLYTDEEEPRDVAPVRKLVGHSRKVGHVLFNPSAENVLATSSGDYTVKLWDVETGASKLKLNHGDIVQSLSWSANGSMLVTTSRDKKLRIWDVRQEKPAHEVAGHSGAKNSRAVWMGEHDRIATTGFSKMSDRQLGLWDVRAPREPLNGFHMLDSISGVCMPFWDDGSQCLYLAGKGDGNIRYFEYENDKFEFLSEYKSSDPQRGIAFLPKRGVNMHENEVMRAFKTVNDAYIEPISFIVPRRAEVFQGDIYPPALGSKPGLSADAWFGGKDAFPPKIDLEKIYEGGEVVEVPQTAVPSKASTSTPAPTPAKTKEPDSPKKTEIAPIVGAAAVGAPLAAQRGPPPAMKDQKSSISTMADKFQDHESDEESSDDGSSFEEIPKPVERSSIPAAAAAAVMSVPSMAAKPAQRPIETSRELPTSPTKSTATAPSTSTTTTATRPTDPLKFPVQKSFSATAAAATRPPSDGGGGSSSSVVASSLQQITRLLEQQNAVISAQSEKIGLLTAEMDSLKTRVGDGGKSSGAKDERIRMLELELEQSRS